MRNTNGLPLRHGEDVAVARSVASGLRRVLPGDPDPTPAQWQAIGESLLQGDDAMDRLVDGMAREGMARTRTLFDTAALRGIAAVPDAPTELRAFFEHVERRPAWVDDAKLLEGARVCGISGMTGMNVLRDAGLLAGYQASAINRTLVVTGALRTGAQRRVSETTQWWVAATRPGAMALGGAGYVATLHVRLIHALVRRHVSALPEWDAARYGLPINQGDMHATYLAFSVIFLLGQRILGVPLRRAESEAAMHLWRYVAWLMGVDEAWLHETEAAGRVALYQNLLAQAPPDESSRLLGRALMDEPLARAYPRFAWIRGRWNRAKHLSIARLFVGARGMKALGLPPRTLPWYPLLTAPIRFAMHAVLRALPNGREHLSRRGLVAQSEYLKILGHRADLTKASGHSVTPLAR